MNTKELPPILGSGAREKEANLGVMPSIDYCWTCSGYRISQTGLIKLALIRANSAALPRLAAQITRIG